ncbi:unnamed protein product [Brachionus calyciflorus]|uniref:G-protein coupled receptors family 1 profile domain-containing protein n=1 Tax=Brachionus calyciflorus TaxID=104777 RepID=A0A814IJ89_9BILA|nr:unnamed protein product [Brachionus calyciflorus]
MHINSITKVVPLKNLTFSNISIYHADLAECLLNTTNTLFDITIIVIKILAFILHIVVFLTIGLNRKFHSRHSIYLINLAIIGFLSVLNGLSILDSKLLCKYNSTFYCQFQGVFFQYSIYVCSYSVLAMAAYRLTCVRCKNLNQTLKIWRIILSIILVWSLSLLFVLLPKLIRKIPIFYHYSLNTCMENYSERFWSFLFFMFFGFILPSLSIMLINVIIVLKIKKSKNKLSSFSKLKIKIFKKSTIFTESNKIGVNGVNLRIEKVEEVNFNLENVSSVCQSTTPNNSRNSLTKNQCVLTNKVVNSQLKLIVQFSIIYFSYLVYSISNFLLIYQTTLVEYHWEFYLIRMFNIFIWLYHLTSPILYLGFHPITIEKFKKFSRSFTIPKFLNKI